MTNPTDGPIHTWFGLSYKNYLVVPRTLMQSMPTEWQECMGACLDELHDAYRHVPTAEVYDVTAATEHIVSELDDQQLKQAGIYADWYGGLEVPDWLSDEGLAQWKAANEDPDGPVYSRDGVELDPHERVLLPTVDPVPHYNRGRTYIQPRTAAAVQR